MDEEPFYVTLLRLTIEENSKNKVKVYKNDCDNPLEYE